MPCGNRRIMMAKAKKRKAKEATKKAGKKKSAKKPIKKATTRTAKKAVRKPAPKKHVAKMKAASMCMMKFADRVEDRIRALGGIIRSSEASLFERLKAVNFCGRRGGSSFLKSGFDYILEEQVLDTIVAQGGIPMEKIGFPRIEWQVERFTIYARHIRLC
jgi:hypothetical protein